jgi:universal stress protein A
MTQLNANFRAPGFLAAGVAIDSDDQARARCLHCLVREAVMLAIRNVLVATDFSDCSTAALDCGRSIADAFGARLHLLHVVPPIAVGDPDGLGLIGGLIDQQNGLGEVDRQLLEGLLTHKDRTKRRAQAVLRQVEAPAHAIVDYATTERMDVIVMGTHGRRGLSHLLLGSVAEHVVRVAPCPVLTVRSPRQATHTADAVTAAAAAE